ncbi:DUF427 domain-containing protein [Arthrobacter sp. NQ7]|uniref:DUF427 domain-containing protein n=1 Tax=Arthrobacter sp. NQ7 TaxID=3032303 RepID=UPI00240F9CDC|nr:DUF427 domain-containing protein [Arthrobacter sp. NQ7]MDJ0457996.1 DUF427 domain-containing protein [Arthrobacter sp. NQ7]
MRHQLRLPSGTRRKQQLVNRALTSSTHGRAQFECENSEDEDMVKAVWNGKVIAESEDTVVVEGNHYFPRDAVNPVYLKESDMHSVCPWKGQAAYYSLDVDGKVNEDAAWYYSEPKKRAQPIKDRIAFWRGVRIEG